MNHTNDATRAASSSTAQRRQRRRQGENRERLITAGIAEFGSLGFFGASTSSIAKRAEVSQPHVYSNFNTKLDLFLACAERVIKQTEQYSSDVMHGSQDSQSTLSTQGLQVSQRPLGSQAALNSHGLQGSVRDAFRSDGQYTLISRFIYQLVAVSGCWPTEAIQDYLQQLQSILSREELHQMLLQAASTLLPPVNTE